MHHRLEAVFSFVRQHGPSSSAQARRVPSGGTTAGTVGESSVSMEVQPAYLKLTNSMD